MSGMLIDPIEDTREPHRRGLKWNLRRVAQFGFLVGQGHDAARIAAEMATTKNNIHRQAFRFGLSFREARIGAIPTQFAAAANARSSDATLLAYRLLAIIGAEPTLIDAILDDKD